MSDELHRISTKAFLKALGGRGVRKPMLALLRMRSPGLTPTKMLKDYVYGGHANGGAHSNSIGAIISYYNRKRPDEPILSIYGAGYLLNTPELNAMATKAHRRNDARLALQEAAQ